MIRSNIGSDFTMDRPRWLQGGASKLQFAFDLTWTPARADAPITTAMVLRMEPPEAIVETSRRREFEMLQAMGKVVPVPPTYWVDAEAEHLPYPGMIYGFATGISMPKARPDAPRMQTLFPPELRAPLAEQFVSHLARIHTADPGPLLYFEPATPGTNDALVRQVQWWRRVWEEDRPEETPLIDVAARWLIDNAPLLDHVSVVHGDYRAGNFLFDEEKHCITAILDWELAVLGDRHQDLTWSTGTAVSRVAEDGTSILASGLLPVDEFLDRYSAASGLSVDPVRLRYFRIFNDFMSTVHMLATAPRVASYGKTHQDVVVAWSAIIGNTLAAKLRDSLEELA
ncbi:phosphotransferase family protein [Sphingobium chlorophenolicum]|nr:phosphotransferase family protein [Sphingobium chlorophenolicum]